MDIDYRKIIESRYNRQNWQLLLRDIFKSRVEFWATPYEISTNSPMAKQALWLGTITLSDDETIAIYEVELSDSVDIERNRRGIRDMLLTEWRNRDAGAFMFCYRKTESVLRFSYVSESWNFAEDGTYQKESTDTKRYTYLLGEGHRSRTAIQQFEELKKSDLNLKALTKAFSVEAVSKMFFDEYKKNYEDIIQFITGKRMVKVANKWEEQVKNEPCEAIMQEFAHFPDPEKSVRDYVKKLMGRLVFLQFLQKKGWLGVKNGEWGSGDAEFLQTLFKNCDDKDHFVDKVLEELFNELNTEHDVEASHFKVPYLNGGLFEREATDETEFPLPAKYMQQMLDFFASYNFTIDENDPDDAEVGVDPEMLGRIFENLLEDNKDKGAFYTPKEIVTYMCRESLIAYLQTDIEDDETKEAIRQFVTTHEKNDKLPSDTDQKLKDVKICDPAIGSGAFPMGLLKELFQCRTALEGIEQSKAAEIKKHIIQNNIYGVDIERGAVDIARLRFWLSLIVDEENPQALPNLDYKIVEGNSLITTFDGQYIDLEKGKGESRYRPSLINIQKEKKFLQAEQKRFFTLTGDEKYRSEIAIKKHILNTIWYQLDFEKHSWQDATIEQAGLFGSTESKGRKKNKAQVAEFTQDRQLVFDKCEELLAQLNDETKSIQERARIIIPFFEWQTVFTEVFENESRSGFDIVIGNPPYGLINKKQNQGDGVIVPDEILDVYKQNVKYSPARGGMLNIFRLFVVQGGEILKQGGVFCEIFPLAFTCDLSSAKLREHIFSRYNIINIEAFPERDNPQKRVFASAKISVCILTFSKTIFSKSFTLRINREPYVEERKVASEFTLEQIRNIDGKNYTIPLTESADSAILVKTYSNSNPYNTIGKCYTGEIDMTFCKKAFTSNSIDCKMLRGANVDRYIEREETSQGEKYYLDMSKLKTIKSGINEKLFSSPRIIMQGITGVNERVRLKMTLACNTFCANSINYCLFKSLTDAKYMLALFNSKLLNYIFKLLSTNSNVNGYEIDNLPIVRSINDDTKNKLINFVDIILNKKASNINSDTSKEEYQIDYLVYKLYGLSYDEVLIVDPETPITREDYESN